MAKLKHRKMEKIQEEKREKCLNLSNMTWFQFLFTLLIGKCLQTYIHC